MWNGIGERGGGGGVLSDVKKVFLNGVRNCLEMGFGYTSIVYSGQVIYGLQLQLYPTLEQ